MDEDDVGCLAKSVGIALLFGAVGFVLWYLDGCMNLPMGRR